MARDYPTTHLESQTKKGRNVSYTHSLGNDLAYPLENLKVSEDTWEHKAVWTNHQEERSDSTQCTMSLSRSLGDRIGSNLAFSYSSIGITCRQTACAMKRNVFSPMPSSKKTRSGRWAWSHTCCSAAAAATAPSHSATAR
jgi:hypothetical protein